MKLLKGFKNFLYKSDFFYSTELLRYKEEPQYRTLFGGVISLLIIIGLIITFYNKLIDTVNKVVITSVSSNLNAADPTPFTISTASEDNFMFGVQIWHHDLNTGDRYFDIVLTNVQLDTGQRRDASPVFPLEPCTLDHWEGFPDVQKDFQRLKMNYWLCLPRNASYSIRGKYASVFSQTLEVAVIKCSNNSNQQRPCADPGQIQAFFQQNGSFFFTIYFINPLINPTSSKYLTHYLQDNNYIIFSSNFGSEGVLFMEEYSILTDQSIFPFTSSHSDHGGVVTQLALKNPYQITPDTEIYCSFAFFKSGISKRYQRNFQKLDQILSYIGGLFGTIAILLFVVNAYNGNSFQITLGAYLFHSKNEKQENTLKSYGFLSYLGQIMYGLLDSIGCSPNWKTIKEYHNCKEQMVKQLDVLYLLKRVFFLQRTMNILFDEHQLKGLHLQQKLTLDQAKRIRKNFQIKRTILKTAKLKKNENTNLTEQSMDVMVPNKVYDSHQFDRFKTIENGIHIFDEIASKDLSIFVKSRKKKQSQGSNQENLNFSDFSSSSSSSENQDSDSISSQFLRLKIETEKGQTLSKRIWQRIDKKMRKKLSQIERKQRTIFVSDSDLSEQIQYQSQESRFEKRNGLNSYLAYRGQKNRPEIDSPAKLNRKKSNQQKIFSNDKLKVQEINETKMCQAHLHNVVLQNQLSIQKQTSYDI